VPWAARWGLRQLTACEPTGGPASRPDLGKDMEMTRQLNDTAAAATQPLLVLQQSVSREGAHEELRERRGGHVATGVVPARRDRIVGCCHHWVIEVAIGPLSKGICKQCGEEKVFSSNGMRSRP
jgi:hypothetical protein